MGRQAKTKKSAGNPLPALSPLRIPLAASIARAIVQSIRDGEWKDTLPGERTLCLRYQVSRPSLRMALTKVEQEGWIRTRPGKVRRICRQPPASQGLAGVARQRIMFFSAYPLTELDPVAVMSIASLRQLMTDAGYYLEMMSAAEFAREHVTKNLETMVASHPSAGWILYRCPQKLQEWFAGRRLPAVIMGTSYPEVPIAYVDMDYRAVTRHAVGLLIGKGHRPDRICLFLTAEHLAGNLACQEGFCEIIRASGGADPRVAIFARRHDLIRQMARGFDQNPPPTGLIFQRPVYALSAAGFLMARLNRMLPRDVSLISLDDDPILRYAIPYITHYTRNPEQFARKLWKVLFHVVQGSLSLSARATLLMSELVPGETVGPPPTGR